MRNKITKEEAKKDLIGLYQAGYDHGYEKARKETLNTIANAKVQSELASYERGIADWNEGFDEGWEDGYNAGKGEVFEEVSNILETTTNEYELIEALYAMLEEKKK